MGSFDYIDDKPTRAPGASRGLVWNILTVLVLLGVVCVAGYILMVFANPRSSLNPFPPIVLPTEAVLPTATPTKIQLPPTWTPTAEMSPTMTPTATPKPPEETPLLPGTPSLTPTVGPSATAGAMSFAIYGPAQAISAELYHPGAGCNWMGISGQAVDLKGNIIEGLVMQLGGVLDGRTFDTQITLTGLNNQNGRYEFTIADHPIASINTLWVQLYDGAGLVPMSEKIYFQTYAECQFNLVILSFKQVR